MTPVFSLVVNHTPWVPERVAAWHAMKQELDRGSGVCPQAFLHDRDYRGTDWQVSKVDWALAQWKWSARQHATHHVFMTDDLHLAPNFWECLTAMIEAAEDESAIGLLSNHPKAVETFMQGFHWYRTNSWIVGPAYVLSHEALVRFLDWYRALPDGDWRVEGTKGYRNDDSSTNEWITRSGRSTVHPLPTIIEHRGDLSSTVGHGDKFSRERFSWRATRETVDGGEGFEWRDHPYPPQPDFLRQPSWWTFQGGPLKAPLLEVGG